MGLNRSWWEGRSVLVTGHTGFKGAWLTLVLLRLGARVTGVSLPPEPAPALFTATGGPWPGLTHVTCDLADEAGLAAALDRAQPSVVFHLAAQALVQVAHADPVGTYRTNVVGTAALLQASEPHPGIEATVVVTSDKVYAPAPGDPAHREGDRLGGRDPYSASKAAAELVVDAWRVRTGRSVATARAGNVLGGGDRGAGRLVPDILRALDDDRPVPLRNPDGVRPWQFVLDALAGYLLLAERLARDAASAPTAVNFGPAPGHDVPAAEVVDRMARLAGRGSWTTSGNTWAESPVLRLDSTLARHVLGWQPALDLDEALAWTLRWHDRWRAGEGQAEARAQIDAHLERTSA